MTQPILLILLSAALLIVVALAAVMGREVGLVLQAAGIVATMGYLFYPALMAFVVVSSRLAPDLLDRYERDGSATAIAIDAALLLALMAIGLALWT